MNEARIIHADCLDALRELPDESVHSVVCDPPYGLANTDPTHVVETLQRWMAGERDYLPSGSGFMGKAWDATGIAFDVYDVEWWHFDYKDWRSYPVGNATFDKIAKD